MIYLRDQLACYPSLSQLQWHDCEDYDLIAVYTELLSVTLQHAIFVSCQLHKSTSTCTGMCFISILQFIPSLLLFLAIHRIYSALS